MQCELFEDDRYTHRMFCVSRFAKPHKVIEGYDKRADVENLVGEAKREGLEGNTVKEVKTICMVPTCDAHIQYLAVT